MIYKKNKNKSYCNCNIFNNVKKDVQVKRFKIKEMQILINKYVCKQKIELKSKETSSGLRQTDDDEMKISLQNSVAMTLLL